MGKIKKVIIPKPDRATVESKPPSMRRTRRAYTRGYKDNRTKKAQYIPPCAVLELNEPITKIVIHERGTAHKSAKFSEKKIDRLIAALSSPFDVASLRKMEDEGKGELKFNSGRTVYHHASVTI